MHPLEENLPAGLENFPESDMLVESMVTVVMKM